MFGYLFVALLIGIMLGGMVAHRDYKRELEKIRREMSISKIQWRVMMQHRN